MTSFLDQNIEYLKGVGPVRGDLLRKELSVFTIRDLLFVFPFRYVDKTQFTLIKDITSDGEQVLVKGKLVSVEKIRGKNRRYRLSALFKDQSGFIELIWFQGIKYIEDYLKDDHEYVIYGRVAIYKGKKSIPHPEVDSLEKSQSSATRLDPVYASTEKLNGRGLDSKARRKLIKNILEKLDPVHVPEILPDYLIEKMKLTSRYQAVKNIHFPKDQLEHDAAALRIKFEDFFFIQLELMLNKSLRQVQLKGAQFIKVGDYFNTFYQEKLPFELTNAQKRVIKEIRNDLGTGIQMNRLLQGDVGSGKTIVALMIILLAIDNGYQACLMAPTEILAYQHYQSIMKMVSGLGVRVGFLSGTIKGQKRKELLRLLAEGQLHLLIGTHALLEDPVQYKNLGIAIIDEQHRFGVAQRARLWKKNQQLTPHILVMTATPIPRTLAMTVYGDLDVSIIDELPPGRKEIKTVHKREGARARVIEFMHSEIKKGRQIYVVFPLIEESVKLDLQNLQSGYEELEQYFPKPHYQISVVHGRMKADDKEAEMKKFASGKAQIMVATTVIEVGVNVPNASVMIIENTERFGLSQLHQLRGRVGRGAEQSFCILMTSNKLTKEAKERISVMVRTNNGFEIAEKDLELRGPGNIVGLRQSGIMDFRLAHILHDNKLLHTARHLAQRIIDQDPFLKDAKNLRLRRFMSERGGTTWGRIS